MKKIFCAAAVLLSFVLSSWALAIELSADVVRKSKGGESSSKMYMKGEKFRADIQNQTRYHIIRQDKNLMWIVLPDSKVYMEIRYSQEQKSADTGGKIPGEVSRRTLGSEMIDGHPTVKYEITYEDNSRTHKIYQWLATDIDFPVKVAAIDGSWSNEYKNIKIGHIPDNLFEIPPGYDRMSIPEMQV